MLLRSGLARNMAGAGLSGAIGHYDITKLNAMSAEPIAHLSLWPARPPGAIIAIVHCFAFPWPSQLLDGSQPFGRSTPGFAERRHFQYAEALGACEWTVDGRPPPVPPTGGGGGVPHLGRRLLCCRPMPCCRWHLQQHSQRLSLHCG